METQVKNGPAKKLMLPRAARAQQRSRAFTIADVLVSLAVVAILIALMMPAMGTVREAARKLVCSSNLRQIGIGIVLYADSHRDRLPPSIMSGTAQINLPHDPYSASSHSVQPNPGNSIAMRFDVSEDHPGWWDSLGILYESGVLETPELYYCPSHRGPHNYLRYADRWRATSGLIAGNYQYRGGSSEGVTKFSLVQPSKTVLVSDNFRSAHELNHSDGIHILRADLSIRWLGDSGEYLSKTVPGNIPSLTASSIYGNDSASSSSHADFYEAYWENIEVWSETGRLRQLDENGQPIGMGNSR